MTTPSYHSKPQPMNTERKVKTVRCNTNAYYPFLKDEYYYVKPEDSSHIEGSVYCVSIWLGTDCLRAKAHYRPNPEMFVHFVIEEFYPTETPENLSSPYATIADVERMIQEAFGNSEKIEEINLHDFELIREFVLDILNWNSEWRSSVENDTLRPPQMNQFIKNLLQKYTIIKK